MRLFRRHALAFDDRARASLLCQVADDRVCFGGVAGPMKLCATTLGVGYKLFEILIEMQKDVVFDSTGLGSQTLPVGDGLCSGESTLTKQRGRISQGSAQLRIGERRFRVLIERFARYVVHVLVFDKL